MASAKNPRKWGQLFNFRSTFIDLPQPAATENIPPVRVTFLVLNVIITFLVLMPLSLIDSLFKSISTIEAVGLLPKGYHQKLLHDLLGTDQMIHLPSESIPELQSRYWISLK